MTSVDYSELGFPDRRERLTALGMMLFMLISALALLPMAKQAAEISPNFYVIVSTIRIVATMLTAYILTMNWRLLLQAPHAILANSYFFTGLATLAQLAITLDPSILPAGAPPATDSVIWLSIAWHMVFALYVALYTSMQRQWLNLHPWVVNLLGWGTLGLFGAVALAISTFGHDLPVFSGLESTLPSASFILHILLYVTLLSCLFLVLATKLRTQQDLWLGIVLFAFALEMMLAVHTVERYSVGWYASGILSMVGSCAMLLVFLRSSTMLSRRLHEKNSHLNQLALSDPLTGLANRRSFDEQLAMLCRYAIRDKVPCTLLMIDIDHFKQYNDSLGHPAGDQCLKHIAMALRAAVWRPLDMIARIGGEEFAILLPGTDQNGANVLATRILQTIRRLQITHPVTNSKIVTASIGGATLVNADPSQMPGALIKAADRALYEAKNAGRNQAQFDGEFSTGGSLLTA